MRTTLLESVGKELFLNGSKVKNGHPSVEGPQFSMIKTKGKHRLVACRASQNMGTLMLSFHLG
jgi:hypothetical protein